MSVIGHAVDRDQFLAVSRDYSGDVFLQLFTPASGKHTRATGDRENNVQIDLGVGIGHGASFT
jgi:hypothetical protein